MGLWICVRLHSPDPDADPDPVNKNWAGKKTFFITKVYMKNI